MKELHFFTNLSNTEQTSEWDLDTMCVDYTTTQFMIDNPEIERVKTTQLSFLINVWDYIENNYKIFIHNGVEVFEVREHMITKYGKEIRKGHNILKLLLAGDFGKIE